MYVFNFTHILVNERIFGLMSKHQIDLENDISPDYGTVNNASALYVSMQALVEISGKSIIVDFYSCICYIVRDAVRDCPEYRNQ